MGIDPYLIAAVLIGAIAQRLVRKLAPNKKTFSGRTVISETLKMDSGLEEIIEHGANQNEILKYLNKNKMQFLKDDAEEKIELGITTRQEAEREVML